ncbi:tryptophan--tRNA ligase [Leptolyngbya sp. 7M]|uniref:tryptophan--tRNA ligase n=1 Tax=Leptolyngbya sp. 7M TaxID=2812896 RepID=UPI001B8B8385|nr:tryptophan--tRNA ligase [Leptolyngbya sp. 7M]QYO65444.1 tryptophan--tRNA ligase [Leptolyngbya sp. 7M]
MRERIFSGAQPTGQLHIGNYLGALKNWVELQDDYESIFCIVNLHAITLPQDPASLRKATLDLARIYLAAGVDPAKSTIFIQSDVPQHAELAWTLSCIARMGELERMTQFKDKGKGNTERAGVGLFTYPILMASDILLYQTDLVPVGQDQKQHLELTRDLAERFNRDYGETFKVPEPYIPKAGASIKSLQDPEKKMSKSDENANGSIFLLDDPDTITKKIKRAVTDSGTDITFDETRPAITNLLTIFQLLTGKTGEECVAHFEGKGYGHFKTELAEVTVEFLKPFQARVKEYDEESLKAILSAGAEKARQIAAETLRSVYKQMGIN